MPKTNIFSHPPRTYPPSVPTGPTHLTAFGPFGQPPARTHHAPHASRNRTTPSLTLQDLPRSPCRPPPDLGMAAAEVAEQRQGVSGCSSSKGGGRQHVLRRQRKSPRESVGSRPRRRRLLSALRIYPGQCGHPPA
jgi:hypothetical protein